MWAHWPQAKIGIALGGTSKLMAVKADGDAGRQTLRELAANQVGLSKTVTILDHDRRIRLFRCQQTQIPSWKLGDGLRILGDGKFVIAPSSLSGSTAKRRFAKKRAPEQVEIARAPAWLLEVGAKPRADIISTPAGTALQQSPQLTQTVVITRASEIEPERIEWIWPNTIASGRVTGLVGYPGVGKSQVALDIAATVSSGRQWPGGAANSKPAEVIILSAEDGPADTIVPRLTAAGANLKVVHVVKAVRGDDGAERPFSIAVDLSRLEEEFDLRLVRLLIVDPVSAYLTAPGGKSVNRNQGGDVRAVLGRCAAFAARHDLAILAVSHLNKSNGARAITRAMGSLEWVAAPRAVFLVTEEPGTKRRLVLTLKNNLAPDRVGYAFEIDDRMIAGDIRTSAVAWSDDVITISADEALTASAKQVTSGAVDFLREILNDGPMDQTEVVRRGKEAGYSEKSLRTAREKLGVTPKKEGFGAEGKWIWVPAGGAQLLRLVVDNQANGQAAGSGDKTAAGSAHAQDPRAAPEPGSPDSDPEKPPEGDAT
jgi:putative DNA primase/helicase